MRSARISACLLVLLLLLRPGAASGQTPPDPDQDAAAELVRVCLAGGRIEIVKPADGGGTTLQALDAAGGITGSFTVAAPSALALSSRIDEALSHVTAAEAESVRRCLQPARDQLLSLAPPPPAPAAPAASLPTPVQAMAPTPPPAADVAAPTPPSNASAVTPAAPAAPQPAAPALADVDKALGQLVQGNVAFATPDHVKLAASAVVEAKLSVTKTPAALIAELTAGGQKQSTTLQVSDKMAAMLSGGDAFDVSPSGPQTQLVSEAQTTSWTWTVTPKLSGKQVLVLSFDALLTVDGQEGARTVNTLRKEIDVEVGWPQNFGEWFAYAKSLTEDVSWLWATILLPIGAFVIHRLRRGRRRKRRFRKSRFS